MIFIMKRHRVSNQKELESLTKQIVEGYDPDKIILFGSFAEGKPHQWSDYDLFIVKDTKEQFHDRIVKVYRQIRQYPSRGVDVLVYTPEELKEPNYFVHTVLSQGKILYEKPFLPKRDRDVVRKSRG